MRKIVIGVLCLLGPSFASAQKAGGAPSPQEIVKEVREYRQANEDRILRELREFLAIPNVASDSANIQKNAERLRGMLEARGFEIHFLPVEGRGPVVFGKLETPNAKRTVIFYGHYDGQPVDPAAWTDHAPFEPILYDGLIEAGGKKISFPATSEVPHYKDEWRLYARSSSDDKSPIVALLVALDALNEKKIPLAVNVKVVFEGEEESGSPNLEKTLVLHKNLLSGDLLLTIDGSIHPSGRQMISFGNRGDIGVRVTVYGATRALHSGHYGNWAPNAAMELAQLLASMKDENGRVRIPGYYDDVTPLSPAERKAVDAMPYIDPDLQKEMGIARPEGNGKKLAELLLEPSLNVRGMRSAYVGDQATNIVPEKAEASLDARLVKGEAPEQKFQQIRGFIEKQGFYAIDHDPTIEERRAHAKIAKVVYEGGYRAARTAMDLPVSQAVIDVVQKATGGTTIVSPGFGGSVPMYIFEDLGLTYIGMPMVNYDNHQHSSDENLRLGHFWNGMEIYGALLSGLNW